MSPDLARRASAEAVGTALLVAIVVGSGIAAERLSPDDTGLQLLENSVATGAGLVALIMALGPVSGAHLNPVVTLVDRLLGGTSTRDAVGYVLAQILGAGLGAVVANVMFDLPAVTLSNHTRSSSDLWLGEVVATFGLVLVILGVARSRQWPPIAFAVGGYIAAAYWFTSSTSFANPAVTIGRTLTDTFAGIRPSSAPMFVGAQLVGGCSAALLYRYWYPPEPNEGTLMADDARPNVLFLCIQNAGRSQMALGWFTHLAGGRAVGWSGGSEPASAVNPVAVAAMAEVGIDISGEQPQRWNDAMFDAADVVVTMGCGDACPFVPGKRYEDWPLDDPAGQGIEAVRPIRDEIERRVRSLLVSFDISSTSRNT